MSSAEVHEALIAEVQETWILPSKALQLGLQFDFSTMLSSICGLAGQKEQARYSAANVFLDSFVSYRQPLSLPACSVDLSVAVDVGHMNERGMLARRLLAQGWNPMNEHLLHKVIYF